MCYIMKRKCTICHCQSEADSKILKYVKCVDDSQENLCEKEICPYYQRSEVYPNSYYALGRDACFKDSYSCCYCMHRIISKEEKDYYCIYEHFDPEKRIMYYLKPVCDDTNITKAIVVIRYWVCPECNSIHEISRKETVG